MTTIQVQSQLSFDALLTGLQQLNVEELAQVTRQARLLRAKQISPSLSERESALLHKINQSLLPEQQTRMTALIEMRQAEQLTQQELDELHHLTDLAEAIQVVRLEALLKLAEIRQQSLDEVMTDLGIHPRA